MENAIRLNLLELEEWKGKQKMDGGCNCIIFFFGGGLFLFCDLGFRNPNILNRVIILKLSVSEHVNI